MKRSFRSSSRPSRALWPHSRTGALSDLPLVLGTAILVAIATAALYQLPPVVGWVAGFSLFIVLAIGASRISSAELLIIAVPVSFYFEGLGSRLNVSASDFVLLAVLVRLLVDRQPDLRPAKKKIDATLLTISVTTLALITSMSIAMLIAAQQGSPIDVGSYVADLLKLVVVIAYLIAATLAFTSPTAPTAMKLLTTWAWTATLVAALGAVAALAYASGLTNPFTYGIRATGTFEDPNAFAGYLVASLGIVLARAYLRQGPPIPLHVIPLLAGIYLSYSRAALFATAAVLIASICLTMGDQTLARLRRALLGLTAVACLAISGLVATGSLNYGREAAVEDDVRFEIWQAAILVWQQDPLLGVGLGQFRARTAAYIEGPLEFLAHNTYISFLAEGGVLGLALFCAIPAAVIIRASRFKQPVYRVLLISAVGLAAMAFTLNLQNQRYVWVFFALMLSVVMERALAASPLDVPQHRRVDTDASR